VAPDQLNDDALGRALDTLYDYGVTELYSLIAATAAKRLGLAPRFTHLDSTSFHVDGRYNSDEEPSEHVVHITKGYSRDHRPDLNQVTLELIVAHQAGSPVLMQPLSGNSSDGKACGHIVHEHVAQLHTTYGPTYLVADSALSSDDNLQKLAATHIQWITRVPATLSEAQAALAQANPQAMAPLAEGYRYQLVHSTYGGVAQRTADKQWRQQSAQDLTAFHKLCRTAFACEADARQALSVFEQDLQVTQCTQVTIRPVARYGKRGRPGLGAQPAQVVYQVDGALASSLAARQARITQQSCFIRATNELDDHQLPPQELLNGYKGQSQAERGFRFLKAPQFLASSL
jgi:transposase